MVLLVAGPDTSVRNPLSEPFLPSPHKSTCRADREGGSRPQLAFQTTPREPQLSQQQPHDLTPVKNGCSEAVLLALGFTVEQQPPRRARDCHGPPVSALLRLGCSSRLVRPGHALIALVRREPRRGTRSPARSKRRQGISLRYLWRSRAIPAPARQVRFILERMQPRAINRPPAPIRADACPISP
jgi:hypothetical protein